MKRRRRLVVALVAGLVLWLGAPLLLRQVGFFRVRQIELVGVRYLAPAAVIGALHLSPVASVFDDLDEITGHVRALPGVADARVVRRVPGSLKVIVREVVPVAFVPSRGTRELSVVDGEGRPLPYDPARRALDLPVAASADSGLVAMLALVQAVDPTLFEAITTARSSRSDVVLELGPRRLLLARDAGPEVIRAVVLVTQDLASRSRRYAEIDARYAGQIVVRQAAGGGA